MNVIVLAALETTGWEDVLQEAKAAGKIVVLEDRRIDAPEDLYTTYVGSDFAEEGRKARVEMCKLLEDMDGTNVWELVGNVGSSAAKDRGQGIFAQNDEMGLGAIEALKEAGLKPGVNVKIVSVDATAGAFKAMLDGELNVTIECNPLLAPQVYEAALKALNGEPLPKWIPTREGVFSADMPNLQEIADGHKY